jgi:hypothetical protein
MSPMEVVIEELQTHERIPSGIAFSERMGFAGKGIESIAQRPARPFHMHRPSWLDACSQRGADLYREQASMLIAMLDRLRQRHRLWNDQRRAPAFARPHPLAVGSHQHAPIAMPPITEPVQLALVGPCDRGGHRLLDQILT